jgi:hypothetical protein
MIALHTREVRTLGDLDFYVKHQLDIIFAGLLAKPQKRAADLSKRQRSKASASRTLRKTRRGD